MLHLNSNGFTVDIAENEEMFNVCFGHQKANLILIDMMMKSLNIYELIRVIRLKSNLPIILIADKENDANRILGLNLGADACVIKPYNPLEVIAEVQAMLRRYTMNLDAAAEYPENRWYCVWGNWCWIRRLLY